MSDPKFTRIQFNLERSARYQEFSVLLKHPIDIPPHLHPLPPKGGEERNGNIFPRYQSPLPFGERVRVRGDFETRISRYERCFGHTAHARVPAYELEYGEEHSYRQPQQLADITAFYAAFGLRLDPLVHERADHITVECEFMHFLIYKEAYALEHDGEEKALLCRQAAYRFLSEHLGRWMPAFSARLAKQAGEGVLKDIADRALSFITEDCQRLGITTGPIDLPVRVIQHEQETHCGSCPLS